MKYRVFFALVLVAFLFWLPFYKPSKSDYFISFDEAQIQNHYTSQDISRFYRRLTKKKWRLLNYLYKTHLSGKQKRKQKPRIPKIIHQFCFVRPPPEKYVKFQKSWIEKHPDWEYHLWTEEDIQSLLLQNPSLYKKTTDLNKKTTLLRYEILNQFGGLFVDLDCECYRPFDILHETCDFYAGIIDEIHNPQIGHAVIGSIPGHPLLQKCLRKADGDLDFTHCFFEKVKKRSPYKNVILPATFLYPLPSEKKEDILLADYIYDHTFSVCHSLDE